MPTTEPHHIIAIGASAGGMEEINSFFDHTPLDGVSYVIIQHLSPDFKSRMVELLARHSKLKVRQAENNMSVRNNEVYLIPNDKFMTIGGGKLMLTEKEKEKGPHLTINRFFNSLAAESGKKAIGIILSGLASDGTEGVESIKKAGGMVIVRDPKTTDFGSMPSHAIATGKVDFVLEPAMMPAKIEEYIKKQEEFSGDNEDDKRNIIACMDLIKEQLSLDFSEYKVTTLLRRIKRRATYQDFTALEKYVDFLRATPEEVVALAQDFLISVTAFFRDKEAFDFLEKNVFPGIVEKMAQGEELKIWVAGCATGEEAYSLAILAREQLGDNPKGLVVKIFATDIDSPALSHAGKGVYSHDSVKHVAPERLRNYFTKEGDNYRVVPEIRKVVIFAQHDLVKNPPYCNMSFISCRNLLIYMTPDLQKKIFSMMLFGLRLDGYLFLGSSENPMPIIQNLEVVSKKWKIYRNIETKRAIRFDAFSLPEVKQAHAHPSSEGIRTETPNTLTEALNSSLVTGLDQLVVCIDENYQVVKSYGDTTKFLLQKNFNTNLAELSPVPLRTALNTLVTNTMKTNKRETVNGIKIKNGDTVQSVSISVDPLSLKKGERRLFVVTFSHDKWDNPPRDGTLFDEKIYHDQYTVNLERELAEMKEKLNSTYLQLDASNENMQSFNEELISANEEMQSTNEEMQSVNEELHTINSDYQLKNKELTELNDDLNNYFRSNINGQLFVNNDLILLKFSPGTVKQINLLPTDIGRPLSNISTNIKFETITEDIRRVIEEGIIVTKEIETKNGLWYQVMTMPYIQQANQRINGAIISFNDITELKKVQEELDIKNRGLLRINEDLDHFVYTASHDLLAPLSNIEGSIEVMNLIDVIDPEMMRITEVINSSARKFRTLIGDLAIIAKLENEMLAVETVDLEEVLADIEWSLQDRIKLSGASIIKKLEIKSVQFSKKNLRSMLFNLISNGIKFKSEYPPVINVQTFKEGEHLILSVEDNGIGISKSDQHKIFDIYGRLQQQDVDGQGVGLFLTKKMIHSMNGNLLVESEPGKGSKFIISLKSQMEPVLVAP